LRHGGILGKRKGPFSGRGGAGLSRRVQINAVALKEKRWKIEEKGGEGPHPFGGSQGGKTA